MIEEKFDAIVIGAGMAGNAAAYTMASRGLKVCSSNAENIRARRMCRAGSLCRHAREDHPEFSRRGAVGAPSRRAALLDDDRPFAHRLQYRSDDFNEESPNRYTIIRSQFDRWFNKEAQAKEPSSSRRPRSRSL